MMVASPKALGSGLGPASASSHYRTWVAGAAVGVFYFNLPLYVSITQLLPVPQVAFVALFALLALPLTIEPGVLWRVVSSPIGTWAVALNILAVMGFFNSSQSDGALHSLAGIFGGAVFLLLMVFLFADEHAHRVARNVLLGCTLVSVGFNVFDILNPLSFSPIVGRAAGLYLNPNVSAFALVVGMAVTIEGLAKRFRAPYILAIGLGVGLTMSRSGILLWALLVLILVVQGAVRLAGIALGLFAMALVGWVWIVLGGYVDLVDAAASGYWNLLIGRLGLAEAPGEVSAQARYSLALAAFRLFANHPLMGAGLGATTEWALPEGSHNMYLRLTAELGILGAGVFPLMALSAARNVGRKVAWRFIPVWVVAGFFSHDLLEERPELTVLAMIGAMTVMNRARGLSCPGAGTSEISAVGWAQEESPPPPNARKPHWSGQ